MTFEFVLYNIILGAGLAMDALGVSVANAVYNPKIKLGQVLIMTGCFGLFQFIMPLAGWLCVRTVVNFLSAIHPFIPWIAGIVLILLGLKVILESRKEDKEKQGVICSSIGILFFMALATSIDALSVGFTIADYDFLEAFFSSLIIGLVTFSICLFGVALVKKSLRIMNFKAELLGGIILIAIGILGIIRIFF